MTQFYSDILFSVFFVVDTSTLCKYQWGLMRVTHIISWVDQVWITDRVTVDGDPGASDL